MSGVLYLSIPGSKLRINAGRFVVTKHQETLADLPSEQVNEVILLGGTQITTQAMRQLLHQRARVHLLTQSERHIGTLEPSNGGRADLLRAQVRRTDDPAFRMTTARAIVVAKLENSRAVLLRWQRRNPQAYLAGEAAEFQRLSKTKLLNAKNENELRGYEGIAAQAYFAALAELLPTHWGFRTRKRRPPTDPINAMLSFGYTLALTKIIGAVQVAGMHPGIGCLHVTHGQRPALALDLLEEFRAPLVDRMVLGIVNRNQISPAAFTNTKDGCRFDASSRDAFVRAFEARLLHRVTHQGKTTTYARLLHSQARHFAAVLQDPSLEYHPLQIR